ncbi:MAG TPA: response regulator transcription factor [Actinomycetales bacterium]|nr:response regulator transcription factor [Actinomycetales bacterium]
MRIVVADESRMFTRGLSLLLPAVSDRRVEVAATTDDAAAAAAVVRRAAPDLALISLGLTEPGGLRAIAATRRAEPDVPILAMSPTDNAEDGVAALRKGASGYLHKTTEPEELITALLAVVDGWTVLPPAVLRALLRAGDHPGCGAQRSLSSDERELWRLVASGRTTLGIAEQLHVSERTAKRLVASLLRRLGVTSRTEAALLAGAIGLLDEDEARGA